MRPLWSLQSEIVLTGNIKLKKKKYICVFSRLTKPALTSCVNEPLLSTKKVTEPCWYWEGKQELTWHSYGGYIIILFAKIRHRSDLSGNNSFLISEYGYASCRSIVISSSDTSFIAPVVSLVWVTQKKLWILGVFGCYCCC